MNRPRLKLGLDASRSTLNDTDCARIGRELKVIRERRGLTIEQVGKLLLLASCQVAALETVQLNAFYGAEFYVAALKKYVVLMGLDEAGVDRALVRVAEADAPLPFERSRKTVVSSLAALPRPSTRVVLAAAVLVSVGVGSVLLAAVRQRLAVAATKSPGQEQSHPVVPVIVREETVPAAPEVADPAASSALSHAAQSPAVETVSDDRDRVQTSVALAVTTPSVPTRLVGRVRVGQPTWVFVRYANGTTIERVLGQGEELALAERPTYLAVGSADETVVEIDGQAIDNSQFIVNGALRVGSSQLAQLVARR